MRLLLQGAVTLLAGSLIVPCSEKPRSTSAVGMQAIQAKLPLGFEQNIGQADPEVKFLARASGYKLSLSSTGAALQFGAGNIRVRLGAARSSIPITGMEELPGKVNYFLGNDPANWR